MRASAGMAYLCLALLVAPVRAGSRPPQAVSPGDPDRTALTQRCPTFSWAAAPAQGGFEIAVFELGEDGSWPAEPLLRQRIAAGATSWTLPGERCLAAGRYAWTIRALDSADEESSAWGETRFFAVEDASPTELERAVERVLERWLAAGKLSGDPPTGAAARGMIAKEPEIEASDSSSSPRPPGDQGGSGTPSFIADTALYDPPNCVPPNLFVDVDHTDSLCEFIEQFAVDQISTGCASGPNRFCPDDPVTRGQLAVYMERAMRGTNTWSAAEHNHFGQFWSGSTTSWGLRIYNNEATSGGIALHATSDAASGGAGVLGQADAAGSFGVVASSLGGIGLYASSASASNPAGSFKNTGGGPGLIVTQGNVGVGLPSPATPLEVRVATGHTLQVRFDTGLVPGLNVNNTGGNAGILRLRNALEVWPSDDATRAGKVDVRAIGGAATINLDGASGAASVNLLFLAPTDSPVACAGGTEGGVYYDDSLSELCVCTGTVWTQTDGGGDC